LSALPSTKPDTAKPIIRVDRLGGAIHHHRRVVA
jgi:hypothetical protein